MNCKNCVYNVLKHDSLDGTRFYWCDRYLDSYGQDRAKQCRAYKPKSNADKIRSMTDEELAEFLTDDGWSCNECYSGQEDSDDPLSCGCDEECKTHCLVWLKHTVKEN